MKNLLGIGVIIGAVTLTAGPVAGGVAMTIGTAALLTANAAPQPKQE